MLVAVEGAGLSNFGVFTRLTSSASGTTLNFTMVIRSFDLSHTHRYASSEGLEPNKQQTTG